MSKEKQDLKFTRSSNRKRVRYVTKEKLARVNDKSLKDYERYLKSSIVKNRDVAKTTYKVYQSNFNIFLCFVLEHWDNFYILDEEFLEENMIDVMEDYMVFLQEDLGNNKKTVNNKIAAVSAFYMWATKRKKIKSHPFDGKLDRMKNAQEEKLIAEYFLDEKQISNIVAELTLVDDSGSDYDKQDQVMWHIAYDSACRIAALAGLKVSNLELENNRFVKIREKRGKVVSVPFTDNTKELIQQFLDLREILGVDCDELFYVKRGETWAGMSKQSIYNRVVKMGYIIGIGDFRPHCIRKSRLNYVAKNVGIDKAQALGNHSSLDTTQRFYTEKEDQSDTLDAIIEMERNKDK